MAITEGDGKGLCVPPDGISQDQANEKILVWLRQNRGTHAMIVFDGIQAAIKGLWNCETSLGNAGTGLDSLGVPETVAQTLGPFLSFCDGDANRVKCANEIVAVDVLAMTGDGSHCTAPDSTTGIELSDRVLAWLRANPQPPQTDTTIAVMTAIDTIWPCH